MAWDIPGIPLKTRKFTRLSALKSEFREFLMPKSPLALTYIKWYSNKYLGSEKQLVYQRGSRHGHFNSNFLVMSDNLKEKLVEECDLPDKELLQKAFSRHCTAMHFLGDSGLTPHMILVRSRKLWHLSTFITVHIFRLYNNIGLGNALGAYA